MKPKVIVLTGPTAAGKTSLSLSLANKYNAEIISADSRQVYRGMDIGTDKIKLKNSKAKGVQHYLINVASPKRTFTVAQYKKQAEKAIRQILKRDRVPMIVGGSPFYIEALVYDLGFPKAKPSHLLRNMLRNKSRGQLFTMLKELDRNRAKTIDKNNKTRLIRAIEIAKTLGKVPKISRKSRYDVLMLGIRKSNSELRKRINKRVDARANAIIKEIKKLRSEKLSYERLIGFGMEYRYYSEHLLGKRSKQEAVEKSKTATWQFARRQRSFFKRFPVVWIKNQREAERKIKTFLGA